MRIAARHRGQAIRLGATLLCATALSGIAHAQDASADVNDLIEQQAYSKDSIFAKPSREYSGLPVGGWLVYPQITVGAVFNDNIYQTPNHQTSAVGIGLRPSITAERRTGINDVLLYSNFGANLYPGQSRGNTTTGSAGFSDIYRPTPDLSIRVFGDYTRAVDISNSGSSFTGNTRVVTYPTITNQFTVGTAVKQDFGRFFVGGGGTVVNTRYDDTHDSAGNTINNADRNGIKETVYLRGGYLIGPDIYTYVEPSVNWRQFQTSLYDSQGYRVVGGFGTSRLSLFRGEVYGGYQQQDYSSVSGFGHQGGGVFGGLVSWLPRRDLTFTASLDEAIGESSVGAVGNLNGSVTKTTAFRVKGSYEINRLLTGSGFFGYSHVTYVNGLRRDDDFLAGATLTYAFARNIGLTLDYRYTRVDSNLALASFDQNQVLVGATYKY